MTPERAEFWRAARQAVRYSNRLLITAHIERRLDRDMTQDELLTLHARIEAAHERWAADFRRRYCGPRRVADADSP